MRYTYVEAWSIIGIVLQEETQLCELCRSDCCRFVLTRDPNALLTIIDRGLAIGHIMLAGGGLGRPDVDTALLSTIDEIQAERKKKTLNQAVLVIEAQGDIEASLKEHYREFDEFIVTWDAIDKQALAKTHRSDINAIKVALAFESQVPPRFTQLTRGVYLTDDVRGKTVYSFTISGSANMFVSKSLATSGADQISARYRLLRQAKDIEKVQRLFSEMADYRNDRLKAFLSGWAALEILIAWLFKTYEEVFLSPFTEAGQRPLRERFLARIKDVMKDKYRLTDKFVAVATVLFPDASDAVDEDLKKFSDLKKVRDSVYHGVSVRPTPSFKDAWTVS